MAVGLRITDGNPIWASEAIVPSRDMVVSPTGMPAVAALSVSSSGVYVYVKVDNIGTVDIGACSCGAALPALWSAPTLFNGFLAATPGAPQNYPQGAFTFTAAPLGDSISGPGVNHQFGISASGRRAWAWSPDGRLFAHVASPNGNDWYLNVVALQPIMRANGTTLAAGQLAASRNGLFVGPFTNGNFSWAGSKAVIASGVSAVGASSVALDIACPYAAGNNVYGDLLLAPAGQVAYAYLVAPCAGAIAITPKILNAGAGSRNVTLVSTASAQVVPFRSFNLPTPVAISGANPSITTVTHTTKGVSVVTGSGTVMVDDPECSSVPGSVVAWVDRVKASTLPSGNLGVLSVGSGVVSSLGVGKSAWVQVPNSNPAGWGNQGERHWCLLAQAYTSDPAAIPKPWNGQATAPPSFPITLVNCAQRNVDIAP